MVGSAFVLPCIIPCHGNRSVRRASPLPSRRMLTTYADHHSVGKPDKRLAIRNSTTGIVESTWLPYSWVPVPSTPSTTRTRQQVSPPHVSSDTASDTSLTVPEITSAQGASIATPTDRDDGRVSTAGARDSDARVFGDTFIASITTLARPQLTAPSNLASHPNSTNFTFPTFSPGTTNNVTTTTKDGIPTLRLPRA